MKLSSKARYGLQIMYYLAKNQQDYQSVTDICCEVHVGEKYVEKLLSTLKNAK